MRIVISFIIGILRTLFFIAEDIKTLNSHCDTLAKMVQQEQYQIDVIVESIKQPQSK